jgi:predicted PurR-regulated permease PerM
LIGIPNAVLWAALTLVLRFVPYVGLWISAFFPLALSFASSTSWTQPILTLLLYGILEVFTNNVIEPVVLGGSTGMSPLAVIIAAAETIGDSTVISWLSGYNASHERV